MQKLIILFTTFFYFNNSVNAADVHEIKRLHPAPEYDAVEDHIISPTPGFENIVALSNCPMPLVPTNGGLVCASFDNIYYCKPMCDQGYDFAFLRRSRLYEQCGIKTAFTWTSQYIGGPRLADCIDSKVIVSGQPSAYFRNGKCENEISNAETRQEYIDEFINELSQRGLKGHKKELDYVACGK